MPKCCLKPSSESCPKCVGEASFFVYTMIYPFLFWPYRFYNAIDFFSHVLNLGYGLVYSEPMCIDRGYEGFLQPHCSAFDCFLNPSHSSVAKALFDAYYR